MAQGFRKRADAIGSGTADPSTAPARATPVPQTAIANNPAPGQRGPAGLGGRTSYSRVNTGLPPTPDTGASAQKSEAPRGLEFLPKTASQENTMTTTSGRPSLQDLIKQAMAGAASQASVNIEAARQIANAGGTPPATVKTAAARPTPESIPTPTLNKLASALDYIARQGNPKLAAIELDSGTTPGVGPGEGPNALTVMQSEVGGANIDAGELGSAREQPPMVPAQQKDPTRPSDPGTGLATNDAMEHPEQPVEPIHNEKATLTSEAQKTSFAYATNLVALGLAKIAYDEKGTPRLVKAAGIGGALGGIGGASLGGVGGAALGSKLLGPAGAVGGALLGMGVGGALGSKAGEGASSLLGGGQPKEASTKPKTTKTAAEASTPLARKGSTAAGLAGSAVGAVAGGTAGHHLAKALGHSALGRTLATGVGGVLGAGIGHHLGGRVGHIVGGATDKGLDRVEHAIHGKKEASAIEKAAAAMAKIAKTVLAAETPQYSAEDIRRLQNAAAAGGLGGAAGSALGGPITAGLGGALGGGFTSAGVSGALHSGLGAGVGNIGGSIAGVLGAKMLGGNEATARGLGRLGALAGGGLGGMYGAHAAMKNQIAQEHEAAAKQASIYERNLTALGLRKTAEDAIFPAQIDAARISDVGPNPPDGATESGEGQPSEPSDVTSQKRLIDSNQAAINATRRETKADPKRDLNQILNEPALSASTDQTLQRVLEHTDSAGAKIAQANAASLEKTAAARVVLDRLAQMHNVKTGAAPTAAPPKKKKTSMMGGGGAPSTPQASSGFNAGSGM